MPRAKKVLFIVDRNLYYRHYGPFIEYLQKMGHRTYLLHHYGHTKAGVKAGYFPSLFSVPQFEHKPTFAGIYYSSVEIVDFIEHFKIDFVFSLNSYLSYHIDISKIRPCKWVVLQHWADNFQHGPKHVYGCDHFLSYSKYWWQCFQTSDYFSINATKLPVPTVHHIGHPLNFLLYELDPQRVKQKYNLPLDKKVLTYLPIGTPNMYNFTSRQQKFWLVNHYSSLPKMPVWREIFSVLDPLLFQSAQTAVNEKKIILAIKRFCKHNDFSFVVKSRLKTPVSDFFARHTDAVFYDETFYPPTISELLFVSDITVSHFSMATFEAIAMKSYKININLEPVTNAFTGHFKTLFDESWVDDFNSKGLGAIMTGDEFIKALTYNSKEEYQFEEPNFNHFMNKYFAGADDALFKKTMDRLIG